MRKIVLLTFTVLAMLPALSGQQLQRQADLRYIEQPLGIVLADLEKRYDLQFTYSPDLIPLEETVNIYQQNSTLEAAIEDICQQLPIQYKAIGSQIMLKPSPLPTGQLSQAQPLQSRSKLAYPTPLSPQRPKQDKLKHKTLQPIHQRPATVIRRPGGDSYETLELDLSRLQVTPSDDIRGEKPDTRLAQISLLPYIGTNLERSDEITNNVSINLIWGTNGGVNGLEVGLLYNKVKQDVNGLQIAGLGSSVNGDVRGTQLAGMFNTNGGHVQGLQAAGLFNLSHSGGQVVQAAGLFNISKGDFAGLQASGLFNISQGKADGLQAGLLFNHSEGRARSQISCLFNQAGDVEGGQISPLLNIADNVAGFQIGLINIADTVSGVPIGLLNIVQHGYNRFELSANDALYANASLKLGAYSFYNIFQAGLRWDETATVTNVQVNNTAEATPGRSFSWGLGYGIGTTLPFNDRMLLNIELVSLQINEVDRWTNKLNLLNQARFTFDYHRAERRTSVFLGPVFHLMFSTLKDAETGVTGSRVIDPSYTLFEHTNDTRSIKGWIGLQGGIRF